MSKENHEEFDLNELYKDCIKKFDQYKKKINHVDFSNCDTSLEKEKRRIYIFKKVITHYINDKEFNTIIPNYSTLFL